MSTITDWLMVIITAVYVVATIFICCANLNSAKAAREQIEISKEQFNETRRIEMMPLLQISVIKNRPAAETANLELGLSSTDTSQPLHSTDVELYIENIGLGTAKEIHYTWVNLTGAYHRTDFPAKAICPQNNLQCYIDIFASEKLISSVDHIHTEIILRYKDLLNNQYSQIISLNFSAGSDKKSITLQNSTISAVEYMKEQANA